MVNFVRPGYLGTPTEFANRFQIPIQNGQCSDSTTGDVNLMRKRAFILSNLLKGMLSAATVLHRRMPGLMR